MTVREDAAGSVVVGSIRASLPALALGLAAFLTQFDVTAVVVVMPSIGRDLGFGVAGYAWVMDAYSLAFTATLLIAGALADRHGRRRALLIGNVLFLLASLACGLAWNGPSLWAARAAQGVGAALVVTGAIALVASVYSAPTERARAFALIGVVSGVAMAAGPTLGGLVGSGIGWRWIFLVNIPLCGLLAVAVPRLVSEAGAANGRMVDWTGVALLTLGLGTVIGSLLHARSSAAYLAGGLVAGLVLLGMFVIQQRTREQPILDPALFLRGEMVAVAMLLLTLSIGYWSVLVYLPLFLQTAFAWSEETVGVALLAATLPMLALPTLGGRLATSWGWRRLFATAFALTCAGGACLTGAALVGAGSLQSTLLLAGMLLIGIGGALAHPQLSGAVVTLAPPEQAGMASAMTVIMRQGGFALGIAVLGASLDVKAGSESFAIMFAVAAAGAAVGVGAALSLTKPPARGPQPSGV